MERNSKKILILGATGRTGKWVLEYAIEKGYDVHVLVSDRLKIQSHSKVTVYEGLPTSKKRMLQAAQNCQAIISVLNISRISDFPWASLRTPKTFLSDTINVCCQVAQELKIKRIVVCSAWGVNETNVHIPFWFRWTINFSNISYAYRDHERQENILKASPLAYTLVRPVGLINSKREQQIQVSYNNIPKPKLTISRKMVAQFMVNALEDNTLIGKTPVISVY